MLKLKIKREVKKMPTDLQNVFPGDGEIDCTFPTDNACAWTFDGHQPCPILVAVATGVIQGYRGFDGKFMKKPSELFNNLPESIKENCFLTQKPQHPRKRGKGGKFVGGM
jgi:hypothetical protein